MKNKTIVCGLIIILWTSYLFLFHLGQKGLWSSQEARNALAARCMLKGSLEDWVIPVIANERSTQKPVLFYWLVTLSCKLGGEISGLFVRLPSALSGIACVLYLFYLGNSLFSRKIGFISSMVLSTCIKFLVMSRTSRIDIFLALCLTVCLGELFLYYRNKRKVHIVLAYLFAGLGTLAKGPVAFILPAVILVCFLLIQKKPKEIFSFFRIEGILTMTAITLPYYLLANHVTDGTFFMDFIIKHNIERFTGQSGAFGKSKPFWFYIPHILTGSLPWTIFFPLMLFFYRIKLGSKKILDVYIKNDPTPDNTDGVYNFFLIAMITIFLFFSMSSFKRGDYILPLFPFISIFVGIYLSRIESVITKKYSVVFLFLSACVLMLIPILYYIDFSKFPEYVSQMDIVENYFNKNDKIMFSSICSFFSLNKVSLILLTLTALCVLLYISISIIRLNTKNLVVSILVLTTILYSYYYGIIESFADRYCNLEPFVNRVKEAVPDKKVVSYHFWNHSLGFHLDNNLQGVYGFESLMIFLSENEMEYLICEQKWFNRLPEENKHEFSVILRTESFHRRNLLLVKYNPTN